MFKFTGHGVWVSEELQACIKFDEAYRNTFTAFTKARPSSDWIYGGGSICRNKQGNPIKFRSREAAESYLVKLIDAHSATSQQEK
jgi:hypothetical protein